MYKKFIFSSLFVLCNIFILTQAPFVLAKTSDEYVDNAYQFIEQGRFDEALTVIREGLKEYPGDIGLVFALAETYHNKKDYETAITNYLSILNAIRLQGQGKEAPAQLHWNLVDAYNELGQKHYFPKELCLRIIYHVEKYLEIEPNPPKKDEIMEFLRKSIGHFDVASMGTGNVKMMETGGDGAEFQLPPDNISLDEKLQYKDRTIQRLKDYDVSRPSLYQTEAPDKSFEEITRALTEDTQKIIAIHYKEINNYMGKVDILDEAFYKEPSKFKTIQHGQVFVFVGNTMYSIDPNTNKIYDTTEISQGDVDYFDVLCKTDIARLSKRYDLTASRLREYPDFLKTLYENISLPNLYLVTAKIKKGQEESWSPVSKLEYFIDLDYNLIVAKREYWKGVLGSGREEDLAKETIVKAVRKYDNNFYLPLEGTTRGFIEELSNLKEDWSIEVVALNKGIDDIEFDVSKYNR